MQELDQIPILSDDEFNQKYDWKNKVEINKGSFATVFKVKSKVENKEVALKIYMDIFKIKEFIKEVKMLNMLQHDNIIKIYESFKMEINDKLLGIRYNYLISMELAEKSFYEVLIE